MKFILCALLCVVCGTTARAAETTSTLSDLLGRGPVTQIKLQHTWCFGTCPIDELTLNSDGSAEFAGHKNPARQGLYRGHIAPDKFAELAKFLENENFFELRAEIGVGDIDDSDTIVSATRGRLPHSVAFRWGTRAELETQFNAAFARAIEQIEWEKDEVVSKSGVHGTVRRDLTTAEIRSFAPQKFKDRPMRFALVELVSVADFKVRQTTRTDQEGRFQFFAPAGRYSISASNANRSQQFRRDKPFWNANGVLIEIEAAQFASSVLQMHDINPESKPQTAAPVAP